MADRRGRTSPVILGQAGDKALLGTLHATYLDHPRRPEQLDTALSEVASREEK